jgi:hypothetical protein
MNGRPPGAAIEPKLSSAKIAPAANYEGAARVGEMAIWRGRDPVNASRSRSWGAVFLREYQDFHDRGQ